VSWARCKELRRRAITSNANLSSLVQGAMTPRSIAPRATGGALFTKTTDTFACESNSVHRTCIHRQGAKLRVALQHNTSPSRPVVDPVAGNYVLRRKAQPPAYALQVASRQRTVAQKRGGSEREQGAAAPDIDNA
jgi:hypothetical protein